MDWRSEVSFLNRRGQLLRRPMRESSWKIGDRVTERVVWSLERRQFAVGGVRRDSFEPASPRIRNEARYACSGEAEGPTLITESSKW